MTAALAGDGTGSISSLPVGIDCGITCTAAFDSGQTVTLTATADISSTFTGWSGTGCTGTADCILTIDAAKSVTATFELNSYTLTTITDGTGSGMISKSPDALTYTHGTTVTLTATADISSTFTGWSGAGCTGTADCILTIDASKSVTATFELNSYTLTTSIDGTGSGSITKSPDSLTYTHGTTVTLTATADNGSTFTGWSGPCTGTGSCVVTMDEAKSVTAIFTLNSYALTTATDGTGSGSIAKSPDALTYTHGTTVTLTALADGGSRFSGWSGDCTGIGACVVTMDGVRSVLATFAEEVNSQTIYLPIIVAPAPP